MQNCLVVSMHLDLKSAYKSAENGARATASRALVSFRNSLLRSLVLHVLTHRSMRRYQGPRFLGRVLDALVLLRWRLFRTMSVKMRQGRSVGREDMSAALLIMQLLVFRLAFIFWAVCRMLFSRRLPSCSRNPCVFYCQRRIYRVSRCCRYCWARIRQIDAHCVPSVLTFKLCHWRNLCLSKWHVMPGA